MGYYKIRMLDKNNLKRKYHAYVQAYNKMEAKEEIKYELLDDEKDDIVDGIMEISEEEYVEGYRKFGDVVRE